VSGMYVCRSPLKISVHLWVGNTKSVCKLSVETDHSKTFALSVKFNLAKFYQEI
jgi:hypothetical protein